jgi:hypothetical protein
MTEGIISLSFTIGKDIQGLIDVTIKAFSGEFYGPIAGKI